MRLNTGDVMSRTIVIGKTDATITLNKTGVPIRGRSRAVLNLSNKDQENEVSALVRAGLLEIVSEDSPSQPIVNKPENISQQIAPIKVDTKPNLEPKPKGKGGRPKGSKNKATLKTEQQKQNKEVRRAQTEIETEQIRANRGEDETQKMGSRVVVQTLDGPRVGRMTNSAAGDILETEKTRDSIAAMRKD
jgi:hypothetical protein